MQNNVPLNSFPLDILALITDFLDDKEMTSAMLVSKQWNHSLDQNELWLRRLIKVFRFSPSQTIELKALGLDKPFITKKLYKKMLNLLSPKNIKEIEKRLPHSLAEGLQDILLLACILDNDNYFFKHAEYIKNYHAYCFVNIYTGNGKIARRLLEGQAYAIVPDLVMAAIKANNLPMLEYLLEEHKKRQYSGWWLKEFLLEASAAGGLSLMQAILKANPNSQFDQDLLGVTAHSSSLPVEKQRPELDSNLEVNKDTLKSFMYSGNLTSVQQVLKSHPNLEIDEEILEAAMYSGNLLLIREVLKSCPNPSFNYGMLCSVLRCGSLPLAQQITAANHDIKIDNDNLHTAIYSGSLALIFWLLDPKQKFNLEINPLHIGSALQSRSKVFKPVLVEYLLLLTLGDNVSFSYRYLSAKDIQLIPEVHKEIFDCYSAFKQGIEKAKNDNFNDQYFRSSYNSHPQFFYKMLETILFNPKMLKDKAFQELIMMDIVQATPLPESQYILIQLAKEGRYFTLEPHCLNDLYDSAIKKFRLLGKENYAKMLKDARENNESFHLFSSKGTCNIS